MESYHTIGLQGLCDERTSGWLATLLVESRGLRSLPGSSEVATVSSTSWLEVIASD